MKYHVHRVETGLAMTRSLAIIAVVGVLLISALVIAVAILASTRAKEDEVCFTAGCVHTASKILENMNPRVDPCDNFYEFACGGFVNSTVIPDDKTRIDVFAIVKDKLYERLRTSIEEPSNPGEPRSFMLVKNLYKTCMDTSAIEKAGLEPLREILRQLGTWPVIEGANWKEDDFNWMESVWRFQKFGHSSDYFISFGVGNEWKNGTHNMVMIDQASLDLSREYLSKGMDDKIVKAYFDYMVNIAVLLGADKQRAVQELRESLEFEIKLAKISLPDEKRRNFTRLNNPMTITKLKAQYPSIRWEEYITNLLPSNIHIDASEVVLVLEPSFISGLEGLLGRTPKRVQANYALWRAVASSVSYLNEDIRKIQLEWSKALNGKTKRKARWQECVTIVEEKLPFSTGALYVRKYFNQNAKQSAVEMVVDISKEFTEILKKSEWMDEKTRSKALEKAATMSSHIAYPDELLDDKKLEEFHAPLELRPNDFIGNIQNLSLFHTNYTFEKLREPVNKSEWITHGRPAVVNAFYVLTENSIQLPAGILQESFFKDDRPRYMNYGAIGFVIGHEITHGFDDKGRQFDKKGNLVDWWAPETGEKYLEKAKCIISQYSNYTDESVGQNLNGINTQGENIADNGGIEVAYMAYKEWAKRNGPEPKLPGLKYTPEQMFWIGAANTWCVKYRPEALKHFITTEAHSPGQYRVLGPFSNMPEFAADFNCPTGSAMNLERKCSVW